MCRATTHLKVLTRFTFTNFCIALYVERIVKFKILIFWYFWTWCLTRQSMKNCICTIFLYDCGRRAKRQHCRYRRQVLKCIQGTLTIKSSRSVHAFSISDNRFLYLENGWPQSETDLKLGLIGKYLTHRVLVTIIHSVWDNWVHFWFPTTSKTAGHTNLMI